MLTLAFLAGASITSKLADTSYTFKRLLTLTKILDLAIKLSTNISLTLAVLVGYEVKLTRVITKDCITAISLPIDC